MEDLFEWIAKVSFVIGLLIIGAVMITGAIDEGSALQRHLLPVGVSMTVLFLLSLAISVLLGFRDPRMRGRRR
jgi:hypothetical protein